MKQLFFSLLMLLAFSSAAYAGNTFNTIDNGSTIDNVQDADTATSGESASLPDGDCVRVTQNDGIFIIDCGDICRLASPVFGVSVATMTEAYADGIIDLLIYEGDRVRATYNGQTADFPICN